MIIEKDLEKMNSMRRSGGRASGPMSNISSPPSTSARPWGYNQWQKLLSFWLFTIQGKYFYCDQDLPGQHGQHRHRLAQNDQPRPVQWELHRQWLRWPGDCQTDTLEGPGGHRLLTTDHSATMRSVWEVTLLTCHKLTDRFSIVSLVFTHSTLYLPAGVPRRDHQECLLNHVRVLREGGAAWVYLLPSRHTPVKRYSLYFTAD